MKPWIKKTLAGIFGVSIAVGGLTACSSGHHHRGPMSAEKMAEVRGKVVERVSSKLDLNDAQKLKLNVLADKMEAQRTAFIGKAADPRAEMQAIVAGATFDRVRAQTLLEEKTRAVQANSPEVIGALADFYDSLNPDQQQKVRELMQRRKGWMARG
ncbi:Spy/CpxP family protein refolding chaperone [Acidovorax sp. ACV01]|uniref:Spy/CpxP family protein refolding chaperone n=1 Tax=Acidovorax sp. ACV01 TaxID=2769311 RepID=UPI0017832586|nr:Spy/CpxP family protein refolding chaperone [Acidovorax sp. ACV01]MBD9393970.1 Spy/CpxP family protein refolding chaperone [Acidovorax sp. ACV01]